jgi:hypothetical protein
MTPRLTPDQELARQIQKMKDMGVTISTRPAAGREKDFDERPFGRIAKAAEEAGIAYKESN